MRTVVVEVTVKLTINADEGVDISEVINEMGYEFDSNTDEADIVDMKIQDFEVKDSK